jgi:hypothetical protein
MDMQDYPATVAMLLARLRVFPQPAHPAMPTRLSIQGCLAQTASNATIPTIGAPVITVRILEAAMATVSITKMQPAAIAIPSTFPRLPVPNVMTTPRAVEVEMVEVVEISKRKWNLKKHAGFYLRIIKGSKEFKVNKIK